jgi:hypothetical protein
VILESTGSYWRPVFNILEGHVQVALANWQEVKARKGHKTDPKDAWWLAHLLRHGMLTPSFIPPRPQCKRGAGGVMQSMHCDQACIQAAMPRRRNSDTARSFLFQSANLQIATVNSSGATSPEVVGEPRPLHRVVRGSAPPQHPLSGV